MKTPNSHRKGKVCLRSPSPVCGRSVPRYGWHYVSLVATQIERRLASLPYLFWIVVDLRCWSPAVQSSILTSKASATAGWIASIEGASALALRGQDPPRSEASL
jgi:hypothetical protein